MADMRLRRGRHVAGHDGESAGLLLPGMVLAGDGFGFREHGSRRRLADNASARRSEADECD